MPCAERHPVCCVCLHPTACCFFVSDSYYGYFVSVCVCVCAFGFRVLWPVIYAFYAYLILCIRTRTRSRNLGSRVWRQLTQDSEMISHSNVSHIMRAQEIRAQSMREHIPSARAVGFECAVVIVGFWTSQYVCVIDRY